MDNVRFDEKEKKAIALIDFDTCMRDTIAAEMGDALRSWCMPGGEDVNEVTFDKKLYTTALEGYVSSATFLDQEEKKSIPFGVMRITLDLAARFTADAFNESYFELDTSKYKNFFEQNKKKAENQFAFFERFKEGLNLDKA